MSRASGPLPAPPRSGTPFFRYLHELIFGDVQVHLVGFRPLVYAHHRDVMAHAGRPVIFFRREHLAPLDQGIVQLGADVLDILRGQIAGKKIGYRGKDRFFNVEAGL